MPGTYIWLQRRNRCAIERRLGRERLDDHERPGVMYLS